MIKVVTFTVSRSVLPLLVHAASWKQNLNLKKKNISFFKKFYRNEILNHAQVCCPTCPTLQCFGSGFWLQLRRRDEQRGQPRMAEWPPALQSLIWEALGRMKGQRHEIQQQWGLKPALDHLHRWIGLWTKKYWISMLLLSTMCLFFWLVTVCFQNVDISQPFFFKVCFSEFAHLVVD